MFSRWLSICSFTGWRMDLLVPRPSTGLQLSNIIGLFRLPGRVRKKTTLKLNCMEFAIHVKLQDVFSTLKLRRFFLHLHEVWWVLFYPGLHLTENQKFHAGDIESETSTNTFAVIAPTRQGSRPEGWYLGGSIGAVLSPDQLASAMDNLRFENYAS